MEPVDENGVLRRQIAQVALLPPNCRSLDLKNGRQMKKIADFTHIGCLPTYLPLIVFERLAQTLECRLSLAGFDNHIDSNLTGVDHVDIDFSRC